MEKKGFLPLAAWAFYDFANTVFSAVVLTVYFPLYLTSLTDTRWQLGAASTTAMLLAAFVMPVLGTLSDQTGKTKGYLIRTTLLCVFFLGFLSWTRSVPLLFFFFVVSCFFYHCSLVFYNALLPVAAPPEKQGFASGLGVGLGYFGVVCTLPIMHKIQQAWGLPQVFWTSGVIFLFCSLPLFAAVPERTVVRPRHFRLNMLAGEWKEILSTVKGLKHSPALLFFLAGNFFLVDAANTVIFWFAVYTKETFHPPQDSLITIVMALNAAAFPAGLLSGWLCDRIGSMKTFILVAAAFAATLGLFTQPLSFPVFIVLSLSGGAMALAGIWTAGRKVLLELSPPDKVGEYFGLYGLTTKISVIGSLLYAAASDVIGMRAGLWVVFIPAATGLVLLLASFRFRARPA